MNQYFIVPEGKTFKKNEVNKISIPYLNRFQIIISMIIIIAFQIVCFILSTSFYKICFLVIPIITNLIIFYLENKNLEIIKDDLNKTIKIRIINYLFFPKKTFEFPIKNINFQIHLNKKNYILMVSNNLKNENGEDFDKSEIKDIPEKFLYYFNNLNVNSLINKNYFLSFSKNQENPLNFDINKYMHKPQTNSDHFNFLLNTLKYKKYYKINEHFFTYYNNNNVKNNKCLICYYRIVIIIAHLLMYTFVINFYGYKRVKTNYGLKIFACIFPHICIGFYILIGYSISKFIDNCFNKFLRIDLVYSKFFNEIFIGIVKNEDKNYIKTFQFALNNINKFILLKNKVNSKGFHLKAVLKENNEITEICYIEENEQEELEGLAYILNEKLNNNNQQILDKLPPLTLK